MKFDPIKFSEHVYALHRLGVLRIELNDNAFNKLCDYMDTLFIIPETCQSRYTCNSLRCYNVEINRCKNAKRKKR